MTDIHRMNSLKAVLGALVNGVAVVAFVVAGAVAWAPGGVMIVGGILGGYAGAAIARRVDAQPGAPAGARRRLDNDRIFLLAHLCMRRFAA